jgi:hypothetical protein
MHRPATANFFQKRGSRPANCAPNAFSPARKLPILQLRQPCVAVLGNECAQRCCVSFTHGMAIQRKKASWRFQASMLAEYGSDHSVCRFLIEPAPRVTTNPTPARSNHTRSQSSQSSTNDTVEPHGGLNNPPRIAQLPRELAEDVLEELVPVSSRGDELSNVFLNRAEIKIKKPIIQTFSSFHLPLN